MLNLYLVAAGGLTAAGWLWLVHRTASFQRARSAEADDRLPLVNWRRRLLAATVFRLDDPAAVLAKAAAIREAVEAAGGAAVYAGRVVFHGVLSEQADTAGCWDGVFISAWDNRAQFDKAVQRTRLGQELSPSPGTPAVYTCGASALPSSLLPGIGLALLRAANWVRCKPSVLPFEPLPESLPEKAARIAGELDEDIASRGPEEGRALCILNLIKKSADKAKANADSEYVMQMVNMFAECNAGPLHIGSAVLLEGSSEWDTVALVRYPSKRFFGELIRSKFMLSDEVGKKKQLGDSLAVATIPILSSL